MNGTQSKDNRLIKGIIYILLVFTAIQSIYPIIWIVMSSFNPTNTLFSTKLVPDRLTISNYVDLISDKPFLLWYWNTFKIALATMIISVIFILMSAYALSQFRFKGRRFSMLTLMVLKLFPASLSLVAIYVLFYWVGLLDTHLGLVLAYAAGAIPYGTWLTKGYFDSIPRYLVEAARMDGCGNAGILIKIIFPLSTPMVAFLSLITFIGPWMDFIFAKLIILSPDKMTLAVGLYQMVGAGAVYGRSDPEFTLFAAGAVLVALPLSTLFIVLQRFLIQGLKDGAGKM